MTREARCDVLVIGGGVCGLWTLWSLLDAGYDAWLIEKSALGDGQTIASQGILHRGTKYDLTDGARDSSREASDAAPVWEAAMSGRAGPDLRRVRVLSPCTHFWTLPSLGAKAVAGIAAAKLQSGAQRLEPAAWPGAFRSAGRIHVYEAPEPVLDPGSLIEHLARAVPGRVRSIGPGSVLRSAGDAIDLDDGRGGVIRVRCGCVVLTAGEGNESLVERLGGTHGLMQRRPLYQLVAVGAPFELFGHCIGVSTEPLLTITTGTLDHERTWYFGGKPAETGVSRDEAEHIAAGREALSTCLPWIDASGLRWRTFRIDRAEGENKGQRPAGPVARWAAERALAVWPTKLVLAPRAASLVLDRLRERSVGATGAKDCSVLASLPEPGVARRVW